MMRDDLMWGRVLSALELITADLFVREEVLALAGLARNGVEVRGRGSQFVRALVASRGEEAGEAWLDACGEVGDSRLPALVFMWLMVEFDCLCLFAITDVESVIETLERGLLRFGQDGLSEVDSDLIVAIRDEVDEGDEVSEAVAQRLRGALELVVEKRGLRVLWLMDSRVSDSYFLVSQEAFASLRDSGIDDFHQFAEPVFVAKQLSHMDQASVASSPGKVVVRFWHWAWRNRRIRWLLVLFVWSLGAAVRAHWGLLVVPVALAWMVRKHWVEHSEYFDFGNVCAAQIVSTKPLLMAALTDLSKGVGDFPAVKVVDLAPYGGNSLKLEKGAFAIGDRLPTVAVYLDDDAVEARWGDFYPLPVALATGDRLLNAQRLASIDAEDWVELSEGLASLGGSVEVGLHLLDADGEKVMH